MEIKLGKKHYLICDPLCYWIEKEYTTTKGTTSRKRVSGYRRTFEEAVENCIECKIKELEVTELQELVKEINKLKKEVKSWKVAVERGK